MTDAGIDLPQRLPRSSRSAVAPAERAGRAPEEALPEPPLTVLTEAEGRALLGEVGVACPASILVTSAAGCLASELGRTVVKVESVDLLHKTGQLGVRPGDVAAYDSIVTRVRRAAPTAVIDGVLVQGRSTRVWDCSWVCRSAPRVPPSHRGHRRHRSGIYGDIAALAPVDAPKRSSCCVPPRVAAPALPRSTPVDVDAAALAIAGSQAWAIATRTPWSISK